MGLFSSKKKISISSVSYNLAGDIDLRPNFVKTTLAGAVLGGDPDRMLGEQVVTAHLNGPGIKQRAFFRWAKRNYPTGMPEAVIQGSFPVAESIIKAEFPAPAGLVTVVQKAFIESADYFYFAERHIYINYPELINTEWTCDYISETNEIIIQYQDTSTEIIPATGYDKFRDYAVAYYYFSKPEVTTDPVIGATSEFMLEEELPALDPLMEIIEDEVIDTTSFDMDTVVDEVITYSDARPEETSSTTTTVTDLADTNRKIYQKTTYQGTRFTARERSKIDQYRLVRSPYLVQTVTTEAVDEEIEPGVIKTTTTTTTVNSIAYRYKDRSDYWYSYPNQLEGEYKMMLYRLGSGSRPALDALQSRADNPPEEFFPFIPLRIKNKMIDDPEIGQEFSLFGSDSWDPEYLEEFYPKMRKAYKKATGGSLLKVLDSIRENESIDDIDHAFMVYGVPLNTKEQAGRKYIYNFFETLIPFQGISESDYQSFLADKDMHMGNLSNYEDWYVQQQNEEAPRYGEPRPAKSVLTQPQFSTINLRSTDPNLSMYDLRLNWVTIGIEIFDGYRGGIKVGDLKIENGPVDVWEDEIGIIADEGDNIKHETSEIQTTYIYWQERGFYKRMTIRGLIYHNFVYAGRAVTTRSREALEDADESPLLIPMHYPTLRAMNIVDSTQLVTANTFIIFNSYQVVKQRWWQRGIFKVLLVVAVAMLTVYFAPAGAVTGGILGTNAAVGGLLGLSGMSALLAGAAINALAAMILVNVVTEVSTRLFGEKWGAVVGVVLGFVAVQGLTNFSTAGQLGMNWGSMMRMENLLQLANVGANAYDAWARGEILETYDAMAEAKLEYEKQSDEIKRLTSEFSNSGVVIDPMMFTDVLNSKDFERESPSDFRDRTLMVGSDLIDLSYSMIYDYVDMNLSLPES